MGRTCRTRLLSTLRIMGKKLNKENHLGNFRIYLSLGKFLKTRNDSIKIYTKLTCYETVLKIGPTVGS
jgi:hypothetical protein